MNPEVLLYSSDENITYSELKNLDSSKFNISLEELQKTQEIFEKNDIKACIMWQPDFHTKFHNINYTPYIMHYIWDISLLDRHILGIVWPRQPSQYSFKVLQNMFDVAQNYDFVTISGMAEWVDQLCHSFSVKYKIPTIAVLGWWIHHFLNWPSRYIVDTIVQNWWLILSEYKINFVPTKYSFPQRNRIVAGLSDILFLPEAWEKSGSLITAEFAYQQNKPIFVTPNDIFSPVSIWIHQLISDKKANIVVNFSKFFAENFKKLPSSENTQKIDLPEIENKIFSTIKTKWALDLSNLMNETKLDADTLMTHLTMLEINNYIFQESPGVYTTLINN